MTSTRPRMAGTRRGLTLTELIVSMAVMTLVMAGITSAILIARHALPDAERDPTHTLATHRALARMMEDIRMAIYVSERSPTAITFNVADRDNDGFTERIRYAWSSTAGDPLTREYNGSAPVTVLEHVESMNLTYQSMSITESYPGSPVWGSEQLLSSKTSLVNEGEYQYDASNWIGQMFRLDPSLFSSESLFWRVTRIRLEARRHTGPDGVMNARIRPVDADNKPAGPVLAETDLYKSSLSNSYTWADILYADCARIAPADKSAFVLEYVSGGGTVAYFRYDKDAGSGLLETSNGGGSWNYRKDESMQYEVYGQIAEPGPDQTLTRHYLTRVSLDLQTQGTTVNSMTPATQLLNRPEMLTAMWEAEFDVNPTTSDRNADGENDWRTSDGSAFVSSSLSGAKYNGTQTLLTSPDHDLAGPITVEATLRSILTGEPLPGIHLYADWKNGKALLLQAMIDKQSDGTQNLIVGDTRSHALYPLITVEGLSAEPFDLRLIIDTGPETVALFVNGVHVATEHYTRETPAADGHHAAIKPGLAAGEFHRISIREGGTGS